MPAELAAGLHIEEHWISPVVTISSPYESETNKILTLTEIKSVRSALAWHSRTPVLVDAIYIRDQTHVVGQRLTSRVILEYEMVKQDNQWVIERKTRSQRMSGPTTSR